MDSQNDIVAMTPQEQEFCEKYSYSNYASRVTQDHVNTREEIFELERATRGQHKNTLWQILRLNRKTASNSSGVSNFCGENDAMRYGIEQEEVVKKNQLLVRALEEKIEEKLGCEVADTVLDCGMFITPLGLYSASPDAYFVLRDGRIVVLEIKCPYSYRNTDLESIRRGFNNKARYRITNTAFSINKNGPLDVRVEKKNDHYRQIQAQLYVTNAVMAIYLVKIGKHEEIHFVDRDEEIIKELQEKERADFARCVKENEKHREYNSERNRLISFITSSYNKETATKLAREGFYNWNGVVKCHFCQKHIETEQGVDEVLATHSCSSSRRDNVRHANLSYREFLPLQRRIDSFKSFGLPPSDVWELAKLNVFLTDNCFIYYCCGIIVLTEADKADLDGIKQKVKDCQHSDSCDRY